MPDFIGLSVKAIGIVPGLASFAERMMRRRAANTIARQLVTLVFWRDGIRARLENIAKGAGTDADLDEIAWRLHATERQVREAGNKLFDAREDKIAIMFGIRVANEIDLVLNMKMGVGNLRFNLDNMVKYRDLSPQLASAHLSKIHILNTAIEDAHTEILRQLGHLPK
jgi:hypothetical protein